MSRPIPRRPVAALLGAAALLVVVTAARPTPAAQEPTVSDCMMGLKDGLKALAPVVTDPAQEDTALAALTRMQGWALTAKQLAPPLAEEQPEDERDAFTKGYRTEMARLVKELAEMEIDILEGRRDAAAARIKDGLIELRNGAHEIYQ